MGSIAAISIINDAKLITQDTKDIKWPVSEPLTWLNAAQRAIALQRPDLNTKLVTHTCVAGTTQTIETNALRFINASHNVVGGYSITQITKEELDEVQPYWQKSDTAATEVHHYIFDDRYPKNFKLFPAPAADVTIEIACSYTPDPVTLTAFDGSDTSPISVDDTLSNAIMYFILAMLYQKNTNITGREAKVQQYYALFYQELGMSFDADKMMSPHMTAPGMG